ncbi:hypothetical protein LJC56_07635 [Christensenellaceae bacterium OttesenSCG-928-K19]|nr:hypothetical protein [Christensenellaceae bacterium OttesenSCG-928-K19]
MPIIQFPFAVCGICGYSNSSEVEKANFSHIIAHKGVSFRGGAGKSKAVFFEFTVKQW